MAWRSARPLSLLNTPSRLAQLQLRPSPSTRPPRGPRMDGGDTKGLVNSRGRQAYSALGPRYKDFTEPQVVDCVGVASYTLSSISSKNASPGTPFIQ